MGTPSYSVQFLTSGVNNSWAYGINAAGLIVGFDKEPTPEGVMESYAAFWAPPDYSLVRGKAGGYLFRVNDSGDALFSPEDAGLGSPLPGSSSVEVLTNGNAVVVDLTQIANDRGDALGSDLNNTSVVGWTSPSAFFIYNLNEGTTTTWDFPNTPGLPGSPGNEAFFPTAINSNGDVAGHSQVFDAEQQTAGRGWLYSEKFYYTPENPPYGFLDLNDSMLAVGFSGFFYIGNVLVPIYAQLGEIDGLFEMITTPITNSYGYLTGVATAVNSEGTIVGFLGNDPDATDAAFVVLPGQSEAINLNDCELTFSPASSYDYTEYTLQAAWDINDSGQIVGMAAVGDQKVPFLLTPVAVPVPVGPVTHFRPGGPLQIEKEIQAEIETEMKILAADAAILTGEAPAEPERQN